LTNRQITSSVPTVKFNFVWGSRGAFSHFDDCQWSKLTIFVDVDITRSTTITDADPLANPFLSRYFRTRLSDEFNQLFKPGRVFMEFIDFKTSLSDKRNQSELIKEKFETTDFDQKAFNR